MYISYETVGVIVNSSSDNDSNYKTISVQRDGFIQAICKTSGTQGKPFIRLQIGKIVVFEGHAENAAYRYLYTPLFPVKVGDIVTYTLTNETNSGERRLYLYTYR